MPHRTARWRAEGDELSYEIKMLDGTLPTATGPCVLFIDPFGRPLSPVSAAGMHRRRGEPALTVSGRLTAQRDSTSSAKGEADDGPH